MIDLYLFSRLLIFRTRGLVSISKCTFMSTFMFTFMLLIDNVLHRSNKNENSLKKHESVSWLFLLDGGLYRQNKLMLPEVSVIYSLITLNDWW